MSFEAYRIGVRLSLLDGMSYGLGSIVSQLGMLNNKINSSKIGVSGLEKQLAGLAKSTLIGGALAGVGFAGLSLFKGPLEEAKKFELEIAKFSALGLGGKMDADAVKFVRGMDTYGTSLRENMVLFRDAQTVFRDSGTLEHAQMVTPMLAKMRFANETLLGEGQAKHMESKFMDMLRVVELRKGLANTQEFATQANMIQQVLTTSGGRVDATQYLNLIKTGGVAAKSLSNKAIYYQLEPIVQEMGGFRTGTGLMSLYSNLVLGRMLGHKPAEELIRIGLIDKSNVRRGTSGALKEIKPGSIKGASLLQSSPVDWVEQVMLPAFTKAGITKEQDVLREIGTILTNRTASNLISTIYQQLPQIRKGEVMSAKAMNIDQADKKARETAAGKEIEMHKQWKNLLNELGTSVLPIAVRMVQGVTMAIKGLTDFARANPTMFKILVVGFASLAAAMAISGTLILVTSGIKALGLALTFVGIGGPAKILLTAGSLTSVGGSLLFMAKAAGIAGIAVAAAIAGWKVGTVINDKVINPLTASITGKKGDTLGGAVYDAMNGQLKARDVVKNVFGVWKSLNGFSSQPTAPKAAPSPFIASKNIKPMVQVTSNTMLDGRILSRTVSEHQAKEMTKPNSGIGGFDGGMALQHPSLNSTR